MTVLITCSQNVAFLLLQPEIFTFQGVFTPFFLHCFILHNPPSHPYPSSGTLAVTGPSLHLGGYSPSSRSPGHGAWCHCLLSSFPLPLVSPALVWKHFQLCPSSRTWCLAASGLSTLRFCFVSFSKRSEHQGPSLSPKHLLSECAQAVAQGRSPFAIDQGCSGQWFSTGCSYGFKMTSAREGAAAAARGWVWGLTCPTAPLPRNSVGCSCSAAGFLSMLHKPASPLFLHLLLLLPARWMLL